MQPWVKLGDNMSLHAHDPLPELPPAPKATQGPREKRPRKYLDGPLPIGACEYCGTRTTSYLLDTLGRKAPVCVRCKAADASPPRADPGDPDPVWYTPQLGTRAPHHKRTGGVNVWELACAEGVCRQAMGKRVRAAMRAGITGVDALTAAVTGDGRFAGRRGRSVRESRVTALVGSSRALTLDGLRVVINALTDEYARRLTEFDRAQGRLPSE